MQRRRQNKIIKKKEKEVFEQARRTLECYPRDGGVMHRHLLLNFLMLVLLLSGSNAALIAAEKPDPKKDEINCRGATKHLFKEAAEGGIMEVELGKIAATKATRDQVKAFGRQMEQDHGKARRS